MGGNISAILKSGRGKDGRIEVLLTIGIPQVGACPTTDGLQDMDNNVYEPVTVPVGQNPLENRR